MSLAARTAAEVAFDGAKEGAFDTKRESGVEKTVTEGMTERGAVGMDMDMGIENIQPPKKQTLVVVFAAPSRLHLLSSVL